MGLSFDELNEFALQDLLDIAYAYAGDSDEKAGKSKATQADINKFTGYRPK